MGEKKKLFCRKYGWIRLLEHEENDNRREEGRYFGRFGLVVFPHLCINSENTKEGGERRERERESKANSPQKETYWAREGGSAQ